MRLQQSTIFLLFLAGTAALASSAFSYISRGFIENRGQVDQQVLYYGSASGMTVYLTEQAVILDLHEQIGGEPVGELTPDCGPDRPKGIEAREVEEPTPLRGCAIWVRFEDTIPSPTIEARGRLDCKYNFLLGNDPEEWGVEVPAYSEIIYRDVWQGVDLVWRIAGGDLHYEIVSKQGAPDTGGLYFDGVETVEKQIDGSFALLTALGEIIAEPLTDRGKTGRVFRRMVMADRDGDGLSERDHPSALLWSTYLGAGSSDIAQDAVLDASGNYVVTGYTESSEFPTTPGAYDRSYNIGDDVFVTKFDATGTTLLWSTYIGGYHSDYARRVRLDSSGNPIVMGSTRSENFPTTPGAYDRQFSYDHDVFLTKLAADGSSLVWSTYLGGLAYDSGADLVLDSSENPLVTGTTTHSSFPVTPGAYDESFNGSYEAFVSKLSASGDSLIWSTFLGGSGENDNDIGGSLSLDGSDNPTVTGWTSSADFPTTPGAYDESFNGSYQDVFVTRLDAGGGSLLWSTYLGGDGNEEATAAFVDEDGTVLVTGWTASSDFPTTPGAYDDTWSGPNYSDAFVTKLDETGSALLMSTYLGGSGGDEAHAVSLDPRGHPVVAGHTWSSNFPTTPGSYDQSLNGGFDVFVTMLDAGGESLLWSTFLGGSGEDQCYAVFLDPWGDPVVTGSSSSSDFPVTPGAYDESYHGNYDAFVSRLDIHENPHVAIPERFR